MAPERGRTLCTCKAAHDVQIRIFLHKDYPSGLIRKWYVLTPSNFRCFIFINENKKPKCGVHLFSVKFKHPFCAQTTFTVRFGCCTHLAVYCVKIRSITLKIRSQRWFEFDFTFCTCSAKRLDEIVYFLLDSDFESLSINTKV